MDSVTRLDLYATGRAYVITRAKRIDPSQVDTEGSDINLFVGSQSYVGQSVVRELDEKTAMHFLDSAELEDLDRLGLDRYGEARKGAAAALTTLRLFRPGTGAAGLIALGSTIRTPDGIEYITTQPASFLTGTLQVTGVVARAVKAGKEFQVGANTLRRFATQPFDATIEVTNDAAAAGGEPRESDGEYRERLRDFWRTARRGILAAIELGARSVPGISSAQAIEALTPGAMPARIVNLFVADSSGVCSAPLAQVVRSKLLDFRAAGIAVVVYSSIPQIVSVALHLRFLANVDTTALGEQVRAAIVEYINSLPVNGSLSLAALYSVLQRFVASGLVVTTDSIVAPVGDLSPTPGLTIRTRIDNVSLV